MGPSVVTRAGPVGVSRSLTVIAWALSIAAPVVWSSIAHADATAEVGAVASRAADPSPGSPDSHAAGDPGDASSTSRNLACDGTDPFLLAELDDAMKTRIGYGETWDESVCDNGTPIYGEGATSRWSAFRVKRAWEPTKDEQFLALAMPIVAFGGLGLAVVIAALIAAVMRLRKQVVVDVECPACAATMPWTVGDGGGQVFCPTCGAPFRVDVNGRGAHAQVAAVPL